MNRPRRSTALSSTPLLSVACLLLAGIGAPASAQAGGSCLRSWSLIDQSSPRESILASSVPQAGMLLPLGPHFFVNPSGWTGIGTQAPNHRLDLMGNGGLDSSIRIQNADAIGQVFLAFEKPLGAEPNQWNIGVDSSATGATRDFYVHDNILGMTYLQAGLRGGLTPKVTVRKSLVIESDDTSLLISPANGRTSFYLDDGVSSYLAAYCDTSYFTTGLPLRSYNGLNVPGHTSIKFENPTSTSPPMMYLFESGGANPDRMILGHSPAYPNWGLEYEDAGDRFHFRSQTSRAVSIEVYTGHVGIGVANPTNILEVKRGSATDPIADSWRVYSSRRWKKNIRPLTDALETVQRLRGVSYQWKATDAPDIGLIAEEVGAVLPELVEFEENGVDARSVDYARLCAVLIEAVKAQQGQIEAMKRQSQVEATQLQRQIESRRIADAAALESRLAALEAQLRSED